MDLTWTSVEIKRGKGNTIDGLEEVRGLKGRYVYVIETPASMAIRYDKAICNICYIGRQGERLRGDRLHAHAKNWISKFLILAQSEEPFRVHYCHPRRRNAPDAFADIEAMLLREFSENYGRTPLFNSRLETEWGSYDVTFNAPFWEPRPRSASYMIDARQAIDDEVLDTA